MGIHRFPRVGRSGILRPWPLSSPCSAVAEWTGQSTGQPIRGWPRRARRSGPASPATRWQRPHSTWTRQPATSSTPSAPYGKAAATARPGSWPRAYRRSLQVADDLGTRIVAFPAIATGVYGFPSGQAAKIAVEIIRTTPTMVQQVRLVAFDQPARAEAARALRRLITGPGGRGSGVPSIRNSGTDRSSRRTRGRSPPR